MKKMYIYSCIGLFAMLIFSGCSNITELNNELDNATSPDSVITSNLKIERNKTTKQELIRAIGAPGMVFKNSKDGEAWVYPRIAVKQTDLGFQSRGNFAALFPYTSGSFSKGGGAAGAGASAGFTTSSTSYKTAGLLIKFDGEGCVMGYEFTATSF